MENKSEDKNSADYIRQNKFVTDSLNEYLEKEEKESYHICGKDLIKFIINSDNLSAKYNLLTMLMNSYTLRLENKTLVNRLFNFYHSHTDLKKYVDDLVYYNPKFNSIEFQAHHGRDMKNDYTKTVSFSTKGNAEEVLNSLKEVLIMVISEGKYIAGPNEGKM